MAVVYSGFASPTHRPSLQAYKRRLYIANGWDQPVSWDGIAPSAESVGIEGPDATPGVWAPVVVAAGAAATTAGNHRFRFRYKNSGSGYVSNPSNEVELTLTALIAQRFPIAAAPLGIAISADTKVDTIVLEATTVGGSFFFVAAEALQTDAQIDFTLSDTQLAEFAPPYPEFGHNAPPIFRYFVPFKDRLFGFGQVEHSDGSVSVTNGSTTVTGLTSNWADTIEGRFLQVEGDSDFYEIATFTSDTSLELVDTYGGTTLAGRRYKIFSRNNDVFYSHASYPESWPSFNFFEGLGEEVVRAMVGFGNGLVIFGLRSIDRFTYADNPLTEGYKRPIQGNRGALTQRVVVVVENAIYSMDQGGVYIFRGGTPEHVSRPIDQRLVDQVDFNFADKFHGVFYPRLRAVRWFVVRKGMTEPDLYFEYEIDRQIWGTGDLEFPITFSTQAPRGKGLGVLVTDEIGYVWWDDEQTVMGGDPDQSNIFAAAGATDTVIPVSTSSLPTLRNGVGGVSVYFPATGERRRVASNTNNELTLDSALAAAPADGDVIYLGRIVCKLRSKAFTLSKFMEKQRGTFLWLYWRPISQDRRMRVRFYRNRRSTAHAGYAAEGYAREKLLQEGVTPPDNTLGETDYLVDLRKEDGVTRIPLGWKDVRELEVEFEIDQPDTPLGLYAYEVRGTAKETVH